MLTIARLCALGAVLVAVAAHSADPSDPLPRYEHIIVIIEENHGFGQIVGNPNAPNFNRLATTYGLASRFYGEVHPSEGNYVAMIGGDTFGIHDDDAWYCKPGMADRNCPSAARIASYVDHTVTARSLIDQLTDHHLSWKGYFEDIPAAGSKAIQHPDAQSPLPGKPNALYASKHNGFINFSTVQHDPHLADKLVGFEQLYRDLASGEMPNYSHIVPNQCNEMHGLGGPDVPEDCLIGNDQGRIARGDRVIGNLVAGIQASPVWTGVANAAVIVTFDEDENPRLARDPQGCCGYDPASAANFGGGHIPTIVITNHGPRSLVDDTPYNHYSLLRTTEEAFGIDAYLGHANDDASGVKPMRRLFQAR
jgi:phospholipase C